VRQPDELVYYNGAELLEFIERLLLQLMLLEVEVVAKHFLLMLNELCNILLYEVSLIEVDDRSYEDEEGFIEQSLLDAVLPDVELKGELLRVSHQGVCH